MSPATFSEIWRGRLPNGTEVLVMLYRDVGELAFREPGGHWGPPVSLEQED